MMKYKRMPFDIKYRDKIESFDYQVETRDGRKAVIQDWDSNDEKWPIVAIVWDSRGRMPLEHSYSTDGHFDDVDGCPLDLFIVTDEPEKDLRLYLADLIYEHSGTELSEEKLAEVMSDVLALAKEEVKSTLPMWKKANSVGYPRITDNHELWINGWYVPIKELENGLPYEELTDDDYDHFNIYGRK